MLTCNTFLITYKDKNRLIASFTSSDDVDGFFEGLEAPERFRVSKVQGTYPLLLLETKDSLLPITEPDLYRGLYQLQDQGFECRLIRLTKDTSLFDKTYEVLNPEWLKKVKKQGFPWLKEAVTLPDSVWDPVTEHTEAEISKLAKDIWEGHAFFSDQVHDRNMLPSVFMPLMMGEYLPTVIAAKDITALWAPMRDAMPRYINGYPMFSSMHMLTRKDHFMLRAKLRKIQALMDEV